ncbi:MAG TPA: DinB family protein [Pyrinomonadaceae bacterium]
MKKTELLERVREAHGKLTAALDGLSEAEATRTGLNENWSVKDALSHISAWEIEGTRMLEEIQRGTWKPQKFDKQMIDDFNARATEERRAASMAEVRAEFDAAHRRMEETLAALPDEVDEATPTYKFAEVVTFRHHTHHAAQIEEYKQRMKAEAGTVDSSQ